MGCAACLVEHLGSTLPCEPTLGIRIKSSFLEVTLGDSAGPGRTLVHIFPTPPCPSPFILWLAVTSCLPYSGLFL